MCTNKSYIVNALKGFTIEYTDRYAVFSVLDDRRPELLGVVGVDANGATAYELSDKGGVKHSQKFTFCGYVSRRNAARLMGYPVELSNSIRVRKY